MPLTDCTLFENITAEQLQSMMGCLAARQHTYATGELILYEGSEIPGVGIILSGQVQISREDAEGYRSIIAVLEENDLFGEVFACAGMKYSPVTAQAEQDDTRIMFVHLEQLVQTCSSRCSHHQTITSNMLKILARKNLMLNKKIEILSRKSIRERVMLYLYRESRAQNTRIVNVPYDRNELADFLGCDRTALSRELSKMQSDGLIEYWKNSFRVL